MSEPSKPETKARPCPVCGKPRSEKYDPFCSKRCADVDLGRWLKGSYVIAGSEQPDPRALPGDDEE